MKRNYKKIDTIIIHCADTPFGREVTAKDVDLWHRQRGFDCIGYHYFIRLDGTVEKGRHEDEVGAHCREEKMNYRSIGICYAGGRDKDGKLADSRTEAQKASMLKLVADLTKRYPAAKGRVYGHRDFRKSKACPCFDAHKEYGQF
ncbi:MAG: N-acetylmuramoyl-L-alanine amidase [Muribaculum sp.]|nr:N-acetylmuramoyl-L-alanine amidase [Muribaculum sp.]